MPDETAHWLSSASQSPKARGKMGGRLFFGPAGHIGRFGELVQAGPTSPTSNHATAHQTSLCGKASWAGKELMWAWVGWHGY